MRDQVMVHCTLSVNAITSVCLQASCSWGWLQEPAVCDTDVRRRCSLGRLCSAPLCSGRPVSQGSRQCEVLVMALAQKATVVQMPRAGPRQALKSLQLQSFNVAQGKAWLESARLEAVLGSCKRSLPSVRSGLQCYVAFVKTIAGNGLHAAPFPPRIEWLQAWSRLFRNARTFSNYLGYVHTGCLVVRAPTEVFEHPALRRAKMAVEKAGLFSRREKLWIRRPKVEAMLRWAKTHPEFSRLAVLFLVAYAFLLRVPSEALPMVVFDGSSGQSVIAATDQEVTLTLQRRKNRPGGSRLVRKCW